MDYILENKAEVLEKMISFDKVPSTLMRDLFAAWRGSRIGLEPLQLARMNTIPCALVNYVVSLMKGDWTWMDQGRC